MKSFIYRETYKQYIVEINRVIQGDAQEILKQLLDNSIDSIVTDPPAGISFMGKEWDDNKGNRDNWIKWLSEVMKESLRVLNETFFLQLN